MIGVWKGPDVQTRDAVEVVWVAGEKRQIMRDCRSGDQRVEGSRRWFAARFPQSGRHGAKYARGVAIERDRIEVGFALLQMRLARHSFVVGGGHVRPDR